MGAAPGYLTTAEAASILYVETKKVSRAITRAPNLFPRTLKFKGRWSVAASDIHGIITALDWENGSDKAANAFWVNLLTGGIPNLDFWLDDHIVLDMSVLHRRVDYRSGCDCGQGFDRINPDDVDCERFNYLYEEGKTPPVYAFSPDIEEELV